MLRVFTSILAALLFTGCFTGCGSQVTKRDPVAFDQVPEVVMKTAREKLPGVTFTRAVIQPGGNYEILGKDAKGRTREIQVSPTGDVTFIDAGRK